MRENDIDIRSGGDYVSCRLMAKSLDRATEVFTYADANPPAGYVLLSFRASQRKRGGRARFITLVYMHTGNQRVEPIRDWATWADSHRHLETMAMRAEAPSLQQ